MSTLEELQLLAARLNKLSQEINNHTTDLEDFLAKDIYYAHAIGALAELIEQDSAKLVRLNQVILDLLEDNK